MQRIFFHNRYDLASRNMFDSLADQEDIKIYDCYGEDLFNLPGDIRITVLPYMIDRYVYCRTNQINVGTPTVIELECRDHLNNLLTEEGRQFMISINGEMRPAVPEQGKIRIQLTCEEAGIVEIRAEAQNYLPFSHKLEVIEDDSG